MWFCPYSSECRWQCQSLIIFVMLKKILLIFQVLISFSLLKAATSGYDAESVKVYVENNCRYISTELLDSPQKMCQYLYPNSKLHIRYNQGVLDLEYSKCRKGWYYLYEPDTYLDVDNVLHIEWVVNQIPMLLECQCDLVTSCKLSIRHDGKVSVSNSMNSWANLFDNREVANVEFETSEGLYITIPIDRSQSLFPHCHYIQTWLYGYVKDGRLIGRFATLGHKHNKEMTSGCEIRRCESDIFDVTNSRLMGYVRNDGFKHYVTPVDDELPYDLWVEGMEGSFNPWEMTGGLEFTPYEIYPEEGFFITRDFILDDFKVFDVKAQADVLQKCIQDKSEGALAGGVVRDIMLEDGIHVREDIGMYGECANDLLYPTMAGNDSDHPQLRLICAYYQIPGQDLQIPIYSNTNLYSQYQEYLSGIEMMENMPECKLDYSGNEVRWKGSGVCALEIYSVEGVCVQRVEGTAQLRIETSRLPSGIYLIRGEDAGGTHVKSIYVK